MAPNLVHAFLGLLLWAFTCFLFPFLQFSWLSLFCLLVILTGTLLPDADLYLQPLIEHRGITHSLRAGLVYSFLVFLAGFYWVGVIPAIVLSFLGFVGYSSHLVLDSSLKL